jgi:hypothetical protein
MAVLKSNSESSGPCIETIINPCNMVLVSLFVPQKSKGINRKIKTFEKNCDEISFAKENYKRKRHVEKKIKLLNCCSK